MPDREDMHGYQNRSVAFGKHHSFCALWLSMGLGKSVSTATLMRDLMWEFEVGRTLVVAPKRVALTTWPMEFRKWSHLRDIKYQVIAGTKEERMRALLKKADVHIISVDNLHWLWETVGNQWPWDMVVFVVVAALVVVVNRTTMLAREGAATAVLAGDVGQAPAPTTPRRPVGVS